MGWAGLPRSGGSLTYPWLKVTFPNVAMSQLLFETGKATNHFKLHNERLFYYQRVAYTLSAREIAKEREGYRDSESPSPTSPLHSKKIVFVLPRFQTTKQMMSFGMRPSS